MTIRRSHPVSAGKKRRSRHVAEREYQRTDLRLERLEERQLLAVGPQLIGIQPNNGQLLQEGDVRDEAPKELIFRFDENQNLDASTLGGIQLTGAGADDVFGTDDDLAVTPGFLGLGETNHEAVMRFATTLPDDDYRLQIFGNGPDALRNDDGELFNDGNDFTLNFELQLGAQILATLPQPITRDGFGALQRDGSKIEIYLNDDDLSGNVADPEFYQLIYTRTTARNTDDVVFNPQTVTYDAAADRIDLDFGTNLEDLIDPTTGKKVGIVQDGLGNDVRTEQVTFRLRVGTKESIPLAPLTSAPGDAGSSFASALDVSVDFDTGFVLRITEPGTTFNVGDQFTIVDSNDIPQTFEFTTGVGSGVLLANGNYSVEFAVFSSQLAIANQIVIAVNQATADGVFNVTAVNEALGFDALVRFRGDSLVTLDSVFSGMEKTTQGLIISDEIVNQTAFPLAFPGALDEPGERDTRSEKHVNNFDTNHSAIPGLDQQRSGVPTSVDISDGITTAFFNFQDVYGFDPDGKELNNVITENQKDRTREIFEIYSDVLGIEFIESDDQGMTIVTGDPRALDPTVPTGPGGTLGIAGGGLIGTAIMDNAENWYDGFGSDNIDLDPITASTFSWFEVAMHEIGHLLGLGHSNELPQLNVMADTNPATYPGESRLAFGNDVETDYPSADDIVHGQHLYRPESKDIDLYRFEVSETGKFTAETIAERRFDSSLLDTTLLLYRENQDGSFTRIARNDDYFSKDSFIELSLDPGNYVIGVSASGNSDYNPIIADTGIGGVTQGGYDLRLNFRPNVTEAITDTDGTFLDGDLDDIAGGVYNFWFQTAPEIGTDVDGSHTIYVDKSAPDGGDGTLAAPFNNIANPNFPNAFETSQPGDIVRIVGNPGADGDITTLDDNLAYDFGFGELGAPLDDGTEMRIPQGVTAMVDPNAILRFRRSNVLAGSTTLGVDFSRTAFQVLGTPGNPVHFTSFEDEAKGLDVNPFSRAPEGGDWGGIIFRQDLDRAEHNFLYDQRGIFLDYVNNAIIQFGGGDVIVDGQQTIITPIQLTRARATISENIIEFSADSALSADPNSFEETNFHDSISQLNGLFTSDFSRVGPDIDNNLLFDNSTNALFIRISTPAGNATIPLSVSARFDDKDMVHFIGETTNINGTPGGPELEDDPPGVVLVTVDPDPTPSTLPIGGTFDYRIVFIDDDGFESPASAITRSATTSAANPAVKLDKISPAPDGFSGRRVYRINGLGQYELIAEMNASDTEFVDTGGSLGGILNTPGILNRPRLDARLAIDPSTIVKFEGARIQVEIGGQFIAEGRDGQEVIFTSKLDDRFGANGNFDTNNDGDQVGPEPGNWGGFYFAPTSTGSIDEALITFAGGINSIEGSFAGFNPIEIHQGEVRISHSVFENNATGIGGQAPGHRFGRGSNDRGTIFVRGAQPSIIDNVIRNNQGPAININANALTSDLISDWGRATGSLQAFEQFRDNQGPLIRDNRLTDNAINGMKVRGETLDTETVWDDTDIVHTVFDTIYVPDFHAYGGLRLESSGIESLVVKLEGIEAGFTATGRPLDINDRIGGRIAVIGQPGSPVVFTSINDDSAGAGFRSDNGEAQTDTNNDGDGRRVAPLGTFNIELRMGPALANNPDAIASLNRAINIWEATLEDPVTVIIDADFAALGPGVLGQASSERAFLDYDLVRLQMISDTRAGEEHVAEIPRFANLNPLFPFDAANPYSASSTMSVPRANALAMGFDPALLPSVPSQNDPTVFRDGVMVFSDALNTPGADFFDVALHEIGHILGFVSAVDQVDAGNRTVRLSPLDMFRLEPGAGQLGFANAPRNYNPTGAPHVFYDGGIFNPIGIPLGGLDFGDVPLSTGVNTGDGNQASHWKDEPLIDGNFIGLLDPVKDRESALTSNDRRAFDLIGWDVAKGVGVPGDWGGLTFEEFSHDRNVEVIVEEEDRDVTAPGINASPDNAQSIGLLASNEKGGDNNLRLGFEIHGFINAPSDIDVYSFDATAGTEIWIDVDRTNQALDSVIELVDANGTIIVQSDDSFAEANEDYPIFRASDLTDVNVLQKSLFEGKDHWGTNRRDAGFRIVLPGSAGTPSTYYLRIRSSNLEDGDPRVQLQDPSEILGGLTEGSYQVQIRLRELDEIPGSTVRFADMRHAVEAIEILGMPGHSPLSSEVAEDPSPNTTVCSVPVQQIGSLNNADRGTLRISAELDSLTDIDYFQFEIESDSTQSGVSHWSVIADVDYADGFARPDTRIVIYDAGTCEVVAAANDSTVEDDLPAPLLGANVDDLSRGTNGDFDPFLGSIALREGSYILAVFPVTETYQEFEQFTTETPVDPLFRLEPANSVTRIVEDRISSQGGSNVPGAHVRSDFITADSVVPFHLGDLSLFVTQQDNVRVPLWQSIVYSVNPFTGNVETRLGDNLGDIHAFDVDPVDGRLYAYNHLFVGDPPTDDDSGHFLELDPGTGEIITDHGDDNLETWQRAADGGEDRADVGFYPTGLAFQQFTTDPSLCDFIGSRHAYVGFRGDDGSASPFAPPDLRNIVYIARPPTSGTADSCPSTIADRPGLPIEPRWYGAGTQVHEVGVFKTDFITTGTDAPIPEVTFVEEPLSLNPPPKSATDFIIEDGDSFTINDNRGGTETYEFDTGPEVLLDLGFIDNQEFRFTPRDETIKDGDFFILNDGDNEVIRSDDINYQFDTGGGFFFKGDDGSGLVDEATFTIIDSNAQTVTYEFVDVSFNPTNTADPGRVGIEFTNNNTAEEILDFLATAVNTTAAINVNAVVNLPMQAVFFEDDDTFNLDPEQGIVQSGILLDVGPGIQIDTDLAPTITQSTLPTDSPEEQTIRVPQAIAPGDIVDIFVATRPSFLEEPADIRFENGKFFVASEATDEILQYNEITGQPLVPKDFVSIGEGGLDGPKGFTFGGPRNDLFVASSLSGVGGAGEILTYNGATGNIRGNTAIFVPEDTNGLDTPYDLEWSGDNELFISSFGSDRINYVSGDGTPLGSYIGPGSTFADGSRLNGPKGIKFNPSGSDLLVANSGNNEILRYTNQQTLVVTGDGMTFTDGQRFSITDTSGDSVIFEFDSNGGIDTNNGSQIAVTFLPGNTIEEIRDAIVQAVTDAQNDGTLFFDAQFTPVGTNRLLMQLGTGTTLLDPFAGLNLSITARFRDTFILPGMAGLSDPEEFTFGPDNNVYVTSRGDDSVKIYREEDVFNVLSTPTLAVFAGGPAFNDGATFTITDANNLVRTFEFDDVAAPGVTGTNVPVQFSLGDTINVVTDSLLNAINTAGGGFVGTATKDPALPNRVLLDIGSSSMLVSAFTDLQAQSTSIVDGDAFQIIDEVGVILNFEFEDANRNDGIAASSDVFVDYDGLTSTPTQIAAAIVDAVTFARNNPGGLLPPFVALARSVDNRVAITEHLDYSNLAPGNDLELARSGFPVINNTSMIEGVYVKSGEFNLDNPKGLAFGPDNNLYVTSFSRPPVPGAADSHRVLRFSGGALTFLTDGDNFDVNDGVEDVNFEFTVDVPFTPTSIPIQFSSVDTTADIADRILEKIDESNLKMLGRHIFNTTANPEDEGRVNIRQATIIEGEHGEAPQLETVNGSQVSDGDSITLLIDNVFTTFEFDFNGQVTAGSEPIPFHPTESRERIAERVADAVNLGSGGTAIATDEYVVMNGPGIFLISNNTLFTRRFVEDWIISPATPIEGLIQTEENHNRDLLGLDLERRIFDQVFMELPITAAATGQRVTVPNHGLGGGINRVVMHRFGLTTSADRTKNINDPGDDLDGEPSMTTIYSGLNATDFMGVFDVIPVSGSAFDVLNPDDTLKINRSNHTGGGIMLNTLFSADGDRVGMLGAKTGDFRGVPAFNPVITSAGDLIDTDAHAIPIRVDDDGYDVAHAIQRHIVIEQYPRANVTLQPNPTGGPALTFFDSEVVLPLGSPLQGSLPTDPIETGSAGLITGIAFVEDMLYGVDDRGGLYVMDPFLGHDSRIRPGYTEPVKTPPNGTGRYIGQVGGGQIDFRGLDSGPIEVENGAYIDLLFGIDSDGVIYAFDTAGVLQKVFVDGQVSVDTGIVNATSLSFGTLERNLWDTTLRRNTDPGHGVPELHDQSRAPTDGGLSYWFGDVVGAKPTSTNPDYNYPGGAHGTLESNYFSLEGYSADDLPHLYISYFLETEVEDGIAKRDVARVWAAGRDGVWTLLNSSNNDRGVFENTGTWRQMRADLSPFAGQEDLQIRIDFATAGELDLGNPISHGDELRSIHGHLLRDGQTFEIGDAFIDTVPGTTQTFEIDLGFTLTLASGKAIPDGENVTIAGTTYEFDHDNDVTLGNVAIPLVPTDTARNVTQKLYHQLVPPTVGNLFNEPGNDIPITAAQANFVAFGGETYEGQGRISTSTDIDLLRLDLRQNSRVYVDINAQQFGSGLNPALRFLDDAGEEIIPERQLGAVEFQDDFNDKDPFAELMMPEDRTIFVEISSQDGSVGDYDIHVAVSHSTGRFHFNDNRLNVSSDPVVLASPALQPSIGIEGDLGVTPGNQRVILNANMVAYDTRGDVDVTRAVNDALNLEYVDLGTPGFDVPFDPTTGEAVNRIKTYRNVNRVIGHEIVDAGPLGATIALTEESFSTNYPDPNLSDDSCLADGAFGNSGPLPPPANVSFVGITTGDCVDFAGSLQGMDNAHEGFFIDDIIIGFIERGEVASNPTPSNLGTIAASNVPPEPILQGRYDVELREGHQFISTAGQIFRSVDTNDRLKHSVTFDLPGGFDLYDGQTFVLSDGVDTVAFEYEDDNILDGVNPARVPVNFDANVESILIGGQTDFTSEPDYEIAKNVRDAINDVDAQAVLDITAGITDGEVVTPGPLSVEVPSTSDRVNLHGNSVGDLDPDDRRVYPVFDFGEIFADPQGYADRIEFDSIEGPFDVEFHEHGYYGDANHFRDQGQLLISSNRVSDTLGFGIIADSGSRGPFPNFINAGPMPHQGPVANLREVNNDRLVPGVTIKNNLVYGGREGGIRFSGDANVAPDELGPVPFGRIVNNTVYGSVNGGLGTGILVENFAEPTLLNNVVANTSVGVSIDVTSRGSVVAGTLYQGNTVPNNSFGVEDFPIFLTPDDPLFVDAANANFYPAAGSLTIDSSIDSLQDRADFVRVTDPLAISPSPIKTPERDVNGLLRGDDPTVSTPAGQGENVFKDRGALDRTDFVGPTVVATGPRDNDADGIDLNPANSVIELEGGVISRFEFRIIDGVPPADPVDGVGVDDSTVTTQKVRLFRDGILLVDGIDYSFSYNETSDTIRLTPLAGIWTPDRIYTIKFTNTDNFAIRMPHGFDIADGHSFRITTESETVLFEFEMGYRMQVPQTLTFGIPAQGGGPGGIGDGETFTINNGLVAPVTFEFDRNGARNINNVAIQYDQTNTQDEIADLIVAAIDAAGLGLKPRNLNDGRVHLGSQANHSVNVSSSSLTLAGQPGGVADGQTFSIDDGTKVVTYEFIDIDQANLPAPGNVAVLFDHLETHEEIAAKVVTSIVDQDLGLNPTHLGDGDIHVGGEERHILDTQAAAVTQVGEPGVQDPFGLRIPTVAGQPDSIVDGQTFTISDGINPAITFELDSDDNFNAANVQIKFLAIDPLDDLADAIADSINLTTLGLNAVNVGNGKIHLLDSTSLHTLNTTFTSLTQLGLPGVPGALAVPILPISRFDGSQVIVSVINSVRDAVNDGALTGVVIRQAGGADAVVEGATNVIDVNSVFLSNVFTRAITDIAGNTLKANQLTFETQFTLHLDDVSLDYGDSADGPYKTLSGSNGPVHVIQEGYFLGSSVDDDADGQPNNAATGDDQDFALDFAGSPGFNVTVRAPYNLTLPANGAAIANGENFTIADTLGNSVNFEFDKTGTIAGDVAIVITDNSTQKFIADAIVTAIENSVLELRPVNLDNGVVYIGGEHLHRVDSSNTAITHQGLAPFRIDATRPGLRLNVPVGGGAAFAEDETFDIEEDGTTFRFEFDKDDSGSTTNGNIVIPITDSDDQDAIADAIVLAITDSDLDLVPVNVGGGLIDPGADSRHSIDTALSALTQTGVGGGIEDGQTLVISDGAQSVTFEFDNDADSDAANTRVIFDLADTAETIANNLELAIQSSVLNASIAITNLTGGGLHISGPLSHTLNLSNAPALGLGQVAPVNVTTVGGAAISDADTFTLTDGVNTVTFEFDDVTDGNTTAGNLAIPFDGTETAADIADLVVDAVNAQGFPASVLHLGNGEIAVNADDEDGVEFLDILNAFEQTEIQVTASGAGFLDAWVDYNQDGDFTDDGEQIFQSQQLAAGVNDLSFTAPVTAIPGLTMSRFRFSSTGGLEPTGLFSNGEVEDYLVDVLPGAPPNAEDDEFGPPAFDVNEDTIFTQPAPGLLENDTDPDGDPIDLDSFDSTSQFGAIVDVLADGSFTYNPINAPTIQGLRDGDSLSDTFTYTIIDSNGGLGTATVTLEVSGINDEPTPVNDDAGSTDEDTIFTTPVVTDNDDDPEGDAISIVETDPITSTLGATVTPNGDGTFEYDPTNAPLLQELDQGDVTVDTFVYTVSDGALEATATVSVTVNGIEDAPIAVDDPTDPADHEVNQGETLTTVLVLQNDTDPDMDTLSIQSVDSTSTKGGTITDNGNGTFDYTPPGSMDALADGETDTDTFTYVVTDGDLTDSATVNVTILGLNDAPVAVNDTGATNENTPFTTVNVLLNDSDVDTNDTLNVKEVTAFVSDKGATVTPNGDGTFTYDPTGVTVFDQMTSGESETDFFDYTVTDGTLESVGRVNLTITGVNDAPVAVNDDAGSTDEDTAFNTLDVTVNDEDAEGDTLTVVETDPFQSTLSATVTPNGDGTFLYDPTTSPALQALQVGDTALEDSFQYRVTDGAGGVSDFGTVTVTVSALNDAPIAVDDQAVNDAGQTIDINVLNNDDDVDGNLVPGTVVVSDFSGPGAFVNNLDGTVTYTPPTNDFTGIVTFKYTVDDNSGATSNLATVSIINTFRPVANDDQLALVRGQSGTVNVTQNDTDQDGSIDTSTVMIVTNPDQGGTVDVNGDGTVDYTPPNANFTGTDTFTYTVNDNLGATSNVATVTVVVSINGFPYNNPALNFDVNDDGSVSPIDALLIINRLNEFGTQILPLPKPENEFFFDVDGDGFISPRDALLVIQFLNDRGVGGGEGESTFEPIDAGAGEDAAEGEFGGDLSIAASGPTSLTNDLLDTSGEVESQPTSLVRNSLDTPLVDPEAFSVMVDDLARDAHQESLDEEDRGDLFDAALDELDLDDLL